MLLADSSSQLSALVFGRLRMSLVLFSATGCATAFVSYLPYFPLSPVLIWGGWVGLGLDQSAIRPFSCFLIYRGILSLVTLSSRIIASY